MMSRKRCHQCAEKVRREARVCRFCGAQLSPSEADATTLGRVPLAVGVSAIIASFVAGLAYVSFRDLPRGPQQVTGKIKQAQAAPLQANIGPKYPLLAVGETLEWAASKNLVPVYRQVGPYTVEITRKDEDDLASPIVTVSAQGQTVSFEGESAQPDFSSKLSAVQNRAGAAPVILLQSYSGGAHCC